MWLYNVLPKAIGLTVFLSLPFQMNIINSLSLMIWLSHIVLPAMSRMWIFFLPSYGIAVNSAVAEYSCLFRIFMSVWQALTHKLKLDVCFSHHPLSSCDPKALGYTLFLSYLKHLDHLFAYELPQLNWKHCLK